jgi:ribosomal protein S21
MNNKFDTQEEQLDPIFENMLKTFSKKIKKDGILDEVKLRRYYSKPSEIKRLEEKRMRNVR